jgi:putative FmdB family regulatory protein
MPLFDFKCEACSEVFEEFTKEKRTMPCPKCGCNANRMISAPTIKLEGWSGSFPSAADAWVKKHNQKAAIEAKRNAE